MVKKKKIPVFLIVIIIVIICLALFLIFKSKPATGSAVYVNYYGISDQPLDEGAGKIQTYVKLSKESINDLKYDVRKADIKIAENIIETADFENGLIELYKANPPVSVETIDYSAIKEGAEAMAENFKINTICIKNAGLHIPDADEMEFIVVTELEYSNCEGNEYQGDYNQGIDWKTAKAKHTFYTTEGHIICSNRDSHTLFVINKKTGEISSNIASC